MHGGWIGVEVFFVVSGFLITSLLLDEHERVGPHRPRAVLAAARAAPAAGARRRARRGGGGDAGRRVGGAARRRATGPAVGARLPRQLGPDRRRRAVLRRRPAAAPAPVEPGDRGAVLPVVAAGLRRPDALAAEHRGDRPPARRRRPGVDGVDVLAPRRRRPVDCRRRRPVNFMYLSTPTRATGLLLGAAAAFVWRPWRVRPSVDAVGVGLGADHVLDWVGGAALGALGCIAGVATLTDGYVYQWLLPLVTVLALVVVLVVVHPAATGMRTILGWAPLVAVGRRSYGLYLWHWPVFVLARRHPRRRPAGRDRPRRHGRGVGAHVSLRRAAGATRGVRRLVAHGRRGTRPPGPAGDGRSSPSSRLLRRRRPVRPRRGRCRRRVRGAAAIAHHASPLRRHCPRRVAIVGDSQAHSLAVNLPDGIESTFTVTDGSLDGCSVYDAGRVHSARSSFDNSFAICAGWPAKWAAAVEQADAEVALVVLGAWDVFDLETGDGTRLGFGTPAWDSYVRANLETGIAALVGAGARVALLEVPCMRPVEAEGAGVPPLPERGDDARVAHVNELFRAVAAAHPGAVTFVEGPDAWCADEAVATDVGDAMGRRARVQARRQADLRHDRPCAAGAVATIRPRDKLPPGRQCCYPVVTCGHARVQPHARRRPAADPEVGPRLRRGRRASSRSRVGRARGVPLADRRGGRRDRAVRRRLPDERHGRPDRSHPAGRRRGAVLG